MMLPRSGGSNEVGDFIKWGSMLRKLAERFSPSEINSLTVYQAFFYSGLAFVPEDGKVKMSPEQRALYGV